MGTATSTGQGDNPRDGHFSAQLLSTLVGVHISVSVTDCYPPNKVTEHVSDLSRKSFLGIFVFALKLKKDNPENKRHTQKKHAKFSASVRICVFIHKGL